jgi:hypothetical protein
VVLNAEEFKIVFPEPPRKRKAEAVDVNTLLKQIVVREFPFYQEADVSSVCKSENDYVIKLTSAKCAVNDNTHTEKNAQVLIKVTKKELAIICNICSKAAVKNQKKGFFENDECSILFPKKPRGRKPKTVKEEASEEVDILRGVLELMRTKGQISWHKLKAAVPRRVVLSENDDPLTWFDRELLPLFNRSIGFIHNTTDMMAPLVKQTFVMMSQKLSQKHTLTMACGMANKLSTRKVPYTLPIYPPPFPFNMDTLSSSHPQTHSKNI